jgi:hypothetical protein
VRAHIDIAQVYQADIGIRITFSSIHFDRCANSHLSSGRQDVLSKRVDIEELGIRGE